MASPGSSLDPTLLSDKHLPKKEAVKAEKAEPSSRKQQAGGGEAAERRDGCAPLALCVAIAVDEARSEVGLPV